MKARLLISLTLFLLLLGNQSMAQVEVKGVVTDDSTGEPLIGATILVKDTSKGTITDLDGEFSITVDDENDLLVISYAGFKKIEVKVQPNMQISLKEDIDLLDEFVVIGYGSQRRSDLTGSLTGVKNETLMESRNTDLFSAMQGRMSGVQISTDSGQPGAGMNIIVRGQTSINGSSSPLFVIDGVQIDVNFDEVASTGSSQARVNPLTGINPADIESIEVLKDASATAIYGSRGANGVVLITTKAGSSGRTVVSYSLDASVSETIRRMPVLSPDDYLVYQEQRGNSQFLNEDTNRDGNFNTPRDFSQLRSFDWQDEALRAGVTMQHQFGVRGGNKTSNYSIGIGVLNQEGLVVNNDYSQYNMRLRLNTNVSEKLSFGFSSNASYSVLSGVANNGGPNSFTGITQQLLLANPWNILTDDVDLVSDGYISPLTLIQKSDKSTNILRLSSSVNMKYQFTENLKYTGVLGTNVSQSKVKEYYGSETSWGRLPNGLARLKEVSTYSYNHSSQLHYNKSIGKNHKIDAMAAFEVFHYNFEDFANTVSGFEDETTGVNNITKGAAVTSYSTQRYNNNRLSYLSRVNYTLFDKYLITASIRADGSDKFGADNRWGYFPSAAFGWRISDESFMQDIRSVSNLKLRLSYGATGNERIPPYTYLAQLDPVFYASNDAMIFGLAPGSLPNPNLKWEVTNQFNAGIDIGLFEGRLNFSADVYQKITTDLLLNAPIPAQSGFTAQWQNIGRIDNYGLELEVSSVNYDKNNFSWRTDFNISFNRNLIKDLGSADFIPITTGGDFQSNIGRAAVGQPIGTMFGFVFDGIYQIEDFAWQNNSDPSIPHGSRNYVLRDDLPVYSGNPQPGRMKYADINGDGVINDDDRQIIGQSNPKHFGGINNTFSYKNFELSVFFQWSYGNDLFNASKVRLNGGEPWANVLQDYFDNHWTPENPINQYPAHGAIDRQISSSYYVEDGSYLRLKTLSFGYTLPRATAKKIGMAGLKVNVIGNNLFTWTNYTGWDPEVNFNNPLLAGLDRIPYPRAKTFTLSLNATF